MLFVLHCKILTGKKKKNGFSLKWLLLASQTSLMGVTNPYVLKNVVSFVLLTNPWSFQIAKDLFIDFFSLPEWNVSSYFKLNSCRILTGKSPWKKCGLFHHAHVINKRGKKKDIVLFENPNDAGDLRWAVLWTEYLHLRKLHSGALIITWRVRCHLEVRPLGDN